MWEWVVKSVTAAIGVFDNKELAFGIAFSILIIALLIWLFLHLRRHRPFIVPIRQLTDTLQRVRDADIPCADRLVEATTAFEEGPPSIAALWREYRKHVEKDPKIPDGFVNLIDPRAWFSADALPGRGYEHWCATWAGVFLTVGLLFTFIGLSAALLKVSAIDGADSVAMKAAITGILGVSSAKFITSIAGLIAYIGFSLVTRRYQSSQQAAIAALADAVQHLSLPLTPERLLYDQNDTALKHLLRLDTFSTDLAIAIDTRLKERMADLSGAFGGRMEAMLGAVGEQVKAMSGTLSDHLERIQEAIPNATAGPIVEAINGLGGDISQSNQQGIKEMLTLFHEHIQKAGQTEMSAVIERLGAVASEINTVIERFGAVAKELMKVQGGMRGAGQDFGTDIRTAAADLRAAAVEMQRNAADRLNALGEQIAQFGANLDRIAQTLGNTPDHIEEALNETLIRLTSAIDALAARLEKSGQLAGGSIEKSFDNAGKKFDQQVTDSTSKLAATVERLDATLEQFSTRLSVVESSLNRLPGAVAEQVTQLEKTGGVFATVEEAVRDSSQMLREAALPLAGTAATLHQSVEQARQVVERSAKTQEEMRQTLQTVLQQLQTTAQAAEHTFKTHETRFGQVDEAMARSIDRLKKGIEEVTQGLTKALDKYDTHLAGALGSLQNGILDLADVIENIPSSQPAQMAQR